MSNARISPTTLVNESPSKELSPVKRSFRIKPVHTEYDDDFRDATA